jgi:hypothetical protein
MRLMIVGYWRICWVSTDFLRKLRVHTLSLKCIASSRCIPKCATCIPGLWRLYNRSFLSNSTLFNSSEPHFGSYIRHSTFKQRQDMDSRLTLPRWTSLLQLGNSTQQLSLITVSTLITLFSSLHMIVQVLPYTNFLIFQRLGHGWSPSFSHFSIERMFSLKCWI